MMWHVARRRHLAAHGATTLGVKTKEKGLTVQQSKGSTSSFLLILAETLLTLASEYWLSFSTFVIGVKTSVLCT